MSDFEKWLEDQDFYTNMRFIHGDKLFDRDGDVYRVLPVQMAYQAWDYRKAQLNNMEAEKKLCHHHWVDGLDGGTMVCAYKCGAWK